MKKNIFLSQLLYQFMFNQQEATKTGEESNKLMEKLDGDFQKLQ